MTQSESNVELLDSAPPAEEGAEASSWDWLLPFVNFWVAMGAVVFIGCGISLASFDGQMDQQFVPLIGPVWVVAGLLAAVTVGLLSEFLVESPSLTGLAPRMRIRLAVLATAIVCANSIDLGLRYLDWAVKQPVVS